MPIDLNRSIDMSGRVDLPGVDRPDPLAGSGAVGQAPPLDLQPPGAPPPRLHRVEARLAGRRQPEAEQAGGLEFGDLARHPERLARQLAIRPREPLHLAQERQDLAVHGRTLGAVQALYTWLGGTVRRLRRRRGWTQDVFADRSGLHRAHIGEIERGETNVTLQTLKTLADTLGVRVVDLVKGL